VFLWDRQYLDGDASHTMDARYRSIGVTDVISDSSGGRAVIERLGDWQTNAFEVAVAIRESGFRGCWVIMIGTNDAANVASGAPATIEDRILRLLYVIGDDPVLWVDTVTTGVAGAYRNESMQAWNVVLDRIDADRDNMAVLHWSQRVRPEWFQPDGIHYTPDGRVWRAAITALALAESFPA
jgi:lysophospholipase L1-like esterase